MSLSRAISLGLISAVGVVACAPSPGPLTLTVSASAVGAEAEATRMQLERFRQRHPEVRLDMQVTPDAADQRHQLYVQWLNGRSPSPDVLQLDVIWTPEFAAAGWVTPLDTFGPDTSDFVEASIDAARWDGHLYGLPWFVDVGLLYWRTDLIDAPPRTLDELDREARQAMDTGATRAGLVWTGARYEGLITVFLEYLGAFGGGIVDARGHVIVDEPQAIRALTAMRREIDDQMVPRSALNWQEEPVRFAFQNGTAAFMRNWPYAWALLQDPSQSQVANKFSVTTFPPADDGRPTAALGGALLAINAHSAHTALAWQLISFLTEPDQMLERARVASQLPSRRSLYRTEALERAIPIPTAELLRALDAATARPVTPVYGELSEILQVRLHRALSGQEAVDAALRDAALEIRTLLARSGLSAGDRSR